MRKNGKLLIIALVAIFWSSCSKQDSETIVPETQPMPTDVSEMVDLGRGNNDQSDKRLATNYTGVWSNSSTNLSSYFRVNGSVIEEIRLIERKIIAPWHGK